MTLEPLVHAPFAVQMHVATVLPAALLGLWLLVFSRKGSRPHRTPEGPVFGLSTTHLFVPFVLFATWRAIDGVWRGNISQHRRWVLGMFVGAIVINGVNNVFFCRASRTTCSSAGNTCARGGDVGAAFRRPMGRLKPAPTSIRRS